MRSSRVFAVVAVLHAVAALGAGPPSPNAERTGPPIARSDAAPMEVQGGGALAIAVAVAGVDLVIVTALVARGLDVRLVLLLGAVPLFAMRGGMRPLLAKMVLEMANPLTVVPIGAALGFAFVLRATECDRHLVQLMMRPLRRVRALLVPGGALSGYLINTTIVSQSGTASVLGPILLPLLCAGGLEPAEAGAVLLLGSSMGGELFNPGAVEMRKLSELTGVAGGPLIARTAGLNLLACGAALAIFWLRTARRRRARLARQGTDCSAAEEERSALDDVPRAHPIKALVPLVPLLVLFADALLGARSPLGAFDGPSKILAAVLIGVVAAGLAVPRATPRLAPAFFEGAGYSYYHVISLIVAASTFAEGVRRSGLIELLVRAISPWPQFALVVAWVVPWALAVVAGTGIAPAVAVMEFFVPAAQSMGLAPARLGAVAALGAHFGRTMSPAAAVVMVSARLSESRPSDLIRLVAGPLLAGAAVMLAAAILGVL